MTLPKQKTNESDADYATRLEKTREKQREYHRKHYEANREKKKEYNRKHYEANREKKKEYHEANREHIKEYREANKEKRKEYDRKRWEEKILASAKGKPLRSDYCRVQRPKMLSRLILKHAEGFCLKYGFPLDQMLDSDVLVCAARTIRDSPELDGTENPWYLSDYLHESLITRSFWGANFRKTWRNKI